MLSALLALHCLFTPPDGWEIADPKMPSKRAIVGFVDKSKSGFCPSLNLTHEKVTIPMKEYLAIVQKNCQAKREKWRLLGTIETQSGKAHFAMIETNTKFGPTRLLQATLQKDEDVFILTVGALKKDFSKNAAKIEATFRSMSICDDLFALAEKDADSLQEAWQKKKNGVESVSFEEKVLELKKLGIVWQLYMYSL